MPEARALNHVSAFQEKNEAAGGPWAARRSNTLPTSVPSRTVGSGCPSPGVSLPVLPVTAPGLALDRLLRDREVVGIDLEADEVHPEPDARCGGRTRAHER